MSDQEQSEMAALLEAATALRPLEAAEARRQETEAAEYAAQLQYQAVKAQVRAVRDQLQQWRQQETLVQSPEAVRALRAQTVTLTGELRRLQAELTRLDEARHEANRAWVSATHGHTSLIELASAAYQRLRQGTRLAADRTLTARERLDADEAATQAFADLCGQVGDAEATRLRTTRERPDWLKR